MLNEIREMITMVKKIQSQFTTLQGNIQQLQQALSGVDHFIEGVNKDVAKWQFKNAPRLARIQKIMTRLDERK